MSVLSRKFYLVPKLSWSASRDRLRTTMLAAGLPERCAELVLSIAGRTRLWTPERCDVVRELASHFAEGIDAGRSVDELIGAFGDPSVAARLIRRSRIRARGPIWKSYFAVSRALGLSLIVVVLFVGISAGRFFLGSPEISVDYIERSNAHLAGIAESDTGYPLLLDAIASASDPSDELLTSYGMVRDESGLIELPDGTTVNWLEAMPGDRSWVMVKAHVASLGSSIESLHRMAEKPVFGFRYQIRYDPAYIESKVSRGADPSRYEQTGGDPSEDIWAGSLISVLLPHLGDARECARVLTLAAWADREAGDHSASLAHIAAALGLGRLMMQGQTLIEQLVGIAILDLALTAAGEMYLDDPGAWSNEQLAMLAHSIAGSLPGERVSLSLEGEWLMQLDAVQRVFTDDGRGGGRMTDEGMRFLTGYASLADSPTPDLQEAAQIADVVLFADRRGVVNYLERCQMLSEQLKGVPLVELYQGEAQRELMSMIKRAETDPDGVVMIYLFPRIDRAFARASMIAARRDAMLLVIASELYRRDHGAWPSEAAALVPGYIPLLPLDPWVDAPMLLRFGPDGIVVYTRGGDGDDDGGREIDLAATPLRERLWFWEWLYTTEGGAFTRTEMNEDGSLSRSMDGDAVVWPFRE